MSTTHYQKHNRHNQCRGTTTACHCHVDSQFQHQSKGARNLSKTGTIEHPSGSRIVWIFFEDNGIEFFHCALKDVSDGTVSGGRGAEKKPREILGIIGVNRREMSHFVLIWMLRKWRTCGDWEEKDKNGESFFFNKMSSKMRLFSSCGINRRIG